MKNKKPEKSKVVWYLALVAFFITIFVIGYSVNLTMIAVGIIVKINFVYLSMFPPFCFVISTSLKL